jgi:hypothetical protein
MNFVKKKLVTAGAAIAAAGLVLAGGPALAASAATTHTGAAQYGHLGPEYITGYASGPQVSPNHAFVPLQLSGVVNTQGFIVLGGGNSYIGYIHTGLGTLAVAHGNMSTTQVNPRSCQVTVTVHTWTQVVGYQSTGVFWGARGMGQATVVISFFVPRGYGPYGSCMTNAPPLRYGASVSFNLYTWLQLRFNHYHGPY